MNTRLLGTLCIIGSAIGVADGVRRVAIGATHEGTFLTLDTVMYLGEAFWLAGMLCGFLGLIALRATGANPIFRLLSWLPVVALTSQVAGALIGAATGMQPSGALPLVAGQLLYMAGVLVVSILVLAARAWRGWRAFVPLLNAVAIPAGAVVAALLGGLDGGWIVTNALASALLGYVVMRYLPTPQVRDDYALAASV